MNINDYKDFYDDFSTTRTQDFLTLSVEDKLKEFKRIHLKYLGDYKYMYFLPQSSHYKLKFVRREYHTKYLNIGTEYNLEYEFDGDLEKHSNHYKRKYRKGLEQDDNALIYRYSRMYLAVSRNRYNYYKYKRRFGRFGMSMII